MLTNIMMAGSILNFLSDLSAGATTQPALNGSNDFETIMNKSMKNSLKTDVTGKAVQSRKLDSREAGSNGYLETLRKGLLAKGKSLDKMYLKDSDIDALTVFLNQCGYNKTDVKKCVEKLLENNPDGKIRLSDFFAQIEKYPFSSASVYSGGKSYHPICLEPSVIPKIESALKDLGLSLKDADNMLNAARSTAGGLDLNKLIAELKGIQNRINGENSKTEDKISAAKFLEKHQGLGLKISTDQETGQITISGFIAALEQFRNSLSGKAKETDGHDQKNHNKIGANLTESGDGASFKVNVPKADASKKISENFAELNNSNDKLPMDVKASIDRIIESAVAPDEKFKLKLTEPSLSQLEAKNIKANEKKGDISNLFQGDQIAESVKKAGNQTSHHGKDGVRNTDSARQEGLNRVSDLNELSAYKKDANSEKDNKDLKSKSADILQQGTPSVKFETLSSALKSDSANTFLPANTIEQLGKQISRSVARGDNIINLQLTPPELGTVKLSMEIKDSVLHLKIIAESSSAKEILLNNSHDLKNLLADQGIKLERLDIQVETNSGRALTDLNEGFGQDHKRYQETGGGLFSDGDIKEDVSSDILKRATKDYLLDLTA